MPSIIAQIPYLWRTIARSIDGLRCQKAMDEQSKSLLRILLSAKSHGTSVNRFLLLLLPIARSGKECSRREGELEKCEHHSAVSILMEHHSYSDQEFSMPRKEKPNANRKPSNKMRRLVERAISLQVKKATTIFMPVNGDWRQANKDRDSLQRSARIAKEKLVDEIGKLEGYLEAHRELRRGSLR
jgi:hypothetical protein